MFKTTLAVIGGVMILSWTFKAGKTYGLRMATKEELEREQARRNK